MFKNFFLNIIWTSLLGILLSSCAGKKENFDIDLSNLKLPKTTKLKTSTKKNSAPLEVKNEKIQNNLVNYKQKSEVLNLVKFGKKDPFSEGSQVNKLNLNLKLTGFLNTENKKYAFVRYLNSKGTITEASIGGVNTNLLPNGAKVINIDPKNMKLTIKFENEDFVFEL